MSNYFKSPNIQHPFKKADCSRRIQKLYELQYNDKHQVVVVEVGEKDIYAEIQTFAHDNDFSRIMHTIEITNNPGLYALDAPGVDMTAMPQSVLEAQKLIKESSEKLKNNEFYKHKEKEYENKYSSGLSMKEFVKIFNKDELIDFYKGKIEALEKAKKDLTKESK